MCGIIGFSSVFPQKDSLSVAHKMLNTIASRGPDQSAYTVTESGVALGHNRLIVRGSNRISQPFYFQGATYAVNGEIYNHHPWDNTDCELVATIPPEELIGEFAFAKVPNGVIPRVTLVRDRFGINPMFYYWKPGVFVFASEPRAILAYNSIDKTIDPRALCCQFVNMIIPGMTNWQYIKSVLPGSCVELTRNSPPIITKYWDVPIDQEWTDVSPERVRDELAYAVSIRTEDTPVLDYVSNGMDGRIVHSLSKNESPKSITCDFGDGDAYKEADYVLKDFPAHLMCTCSERAERTIYNPIGVAKYKMAEKAKELGYNAILSGQGADELFCGYQFLYNAPWSSLSDCSSVEHEAFEDIYGFTPQMFHPWIKLWRASVFEYDPFAEIAQMFEWIKSYDPITVQQYLWIKTHFESQILTWGGDRPEMYHSIEGRVPYLDLVDCAFQIRPHNRMDKAILRETFGYTQPKYSFMYPYGDRGKYTCKWLRDNIVGALADVAYWQYHTMPQIVA